MSTDSNHLTKRALFYLENPLLFAKTVKKELGDEITFAGDTLRFSEFIESGRIELIGVDYVVGSESHDESMLSEQEKATILYTILCMFAKSIHSSELLSESDRRNALAFARFWCAK
jgi:hypothetical protein